MTNNLLTVLGVQGLSHAKYTAAELKIMLRIIQLKQQYVKESVIRYELNHDGMVFSPEQRAAGHVVMEVKMSELGLGSNHMAQLRGILEGMQRKPIGVPYKVGDITSCLWFVNLFTCEVYQHPKSKTWWVKFKFDNNLLRFFFSFDKGAATIDMNVVNQLRSAHSIKLYLVMRCWATKGFTRIKTCNLMSMFYADKAYHKSWSLLNRQLLKPATAELKRLYDHRLIDKYFTYRSVYMEEPGRKRHQMPEFITFDLHDRRLSGEDTSDTSVQQELRGERSKLKLLLTSRYGINDKVALRLSNRLTLDMLGDMSDWFMRKEYYLQKSRQEQKSVSLAGYIVKALDGFFRDRKV